MIRKKMKELISQQR